MGYYRAHKADANAAALCTYWRLKGGESMYIDREVDCIWGKYGLLCWVEIKDGSKPPSAKKLTKREEDFRAKWEGKGLYFVVENEADVDKVDSTLLNMAIKLRRE